MKVLYDHQAFVMQHVGGISRYFSALIGGMPEAVLALRFTDNLHIRSIDRFAQSLEPRDAEYARFGFGLNFRGKKRLYREWNAFWKRPGDANVAASIEALKAGDFDVFHPTYYDPYFLPHLNGKPFVLTIHDMIHEKFPEFFSLQEPAGRNKRILAERAARIIAISERTKSDIVDLYGIPASRIDVVYHGSDLPKPSAEEIRPGAGGYILYTGTRTGYKNFYFMAAALASLLRGHSELSLVCTGPGFSASELRYFQELGIDDKVFHRFVADTELYALYRDAACFVFPSYYEGFGIPILEAFGAGCPAVLADASCFREIAGDAALYFDPKDGECLRRHVRSILEDHIHVEALIRKGSERLRCFSWAKTVAGTMSVYEKALSGATIPLGASGSSEGLGKL